MARSYNVSFNINGALDGSLLAALQNAANAMRGLGNAARATSANARASQAGLQGLATSLTSLQQAAQRYQALQSAISQTQAKINANSQVAQNYRAAAAQVDELSRKLNNLKKNRQQLNQSLAKEQALLSQLRVTQAKALQAWRADKGNSDLKLQLEAANRAFFAQKAKVDQLKATYQQLQAQIRQVKGELTAAADKQKALGADNAALQQARQQYQQQFQALYQLKRQLVAAGFDVSNFAASESRLAADINRVNAALARQTELTNAQRASQQASQNMFNAYNNFQSAIQTAEQMASPFTSAIDKAQEFERVMSEVKALTQMDNIKAGNFDAVEREMKALENQALELGATTIFKAHEVGEAQAYVARTGWSTPQVLGSIPTFLRLAASQHMDIARTADIATNIMTAFGHNMAAVGNDADKFAKMIAHDADVFAYTVTHSNQNLEQFGEAMKYAAPVAKNFGATIEEASMMTKFMADAGIQGSMAGTSMRQTMLRLIAPPKKATKAMEQYGITLDDANAAWQNANAVAKEYGVTLDENLPVGRQFINVMRQIDKNMAGESNQKKLAATSAIVGINAVSGAANLFGAGANQAENFTQLLEQCEGALEQTYNVMTDNTFGAAKSFESAWEAVQLAVGRSLNGVARATYETFAPMLTSLSQFIDAHPGVVQAAAAIAGALAGLIVAAAAVKLAFAGFTFITTSIQLVSTALASLGSGALLGGLIGRIAALRTALFGLGGAATIGGWGAMFAAISARATAAAVAVRTFFASLTLGSAANSTVGVLSSIGTAIKGVTRAALGFVFSPIGVALMLLGAAAYYCYQNWDKVSAVFSNIAGIVTGALSPALEQIKTSLNAISSSGAFDGLFSALSRLANLVGGYVVKAFAVLATVIASTLAVAIRAIADFVTYAADAITGLMDVFGKLSEGDFSGAFEAWQSHGAKAIDNIKNLGSHAFDGMLQGAENVQQVLDALNMPNLPTKEVTARHAIHFDASGTAHATPEVPATSESAPAEAPALDTSATQSALDAVGSSAQNAATNMDAVNTATQNISQAGTNLQTLGTNSQTAGLNVQTLGTNSQTAGLNVQAVGNAAQTTAPQVDSLGTSSGMAFGNVDLLGGSAGAASGQVDAMSSAAGAVAEALRGKAAEIGAIHISVPTVSVGGGQPAMQNYMGGIYRKGAFVTTFAERSAEAAIPLDGSRRAQDLWTQAGQILGLLPSTQSVTYDIPRNRGETKYRGREVALRRGSRPAERTRRETFAIPYDTSRNIPQLPKIFTQTQSTTYDIEKIFTQAKETIIRELPGQIISARASGGASVGLIDKIIGALSSSQTNLSFLPKIFTRTQPTTYNSQAQSEIYNTSTKSVSLPKIFTQTQPTTYDRPRNFDDTGYRGQNVVLPQVSRARHETFAKLYDTARNVPQLPKILTQTQPAMELSMPLSGDAPNQLISAQDTAGLVDRSATTSATTLNVTINVNISGNADEQTVQRGVESALPALDDWLARHKDFQHEERRRSYA